MPAHSIEWKVLLCLVVAAACGKDTAAPVETPPDPGPMHVQISHHLRRAAVAARRHSSYFTAGKTYFGTNTRCPVNKTGSA